MKLDQRHAPLVNAALMAVILPFFMTLVLSLLNLGFSRGLLAAWMRAWGIAAIVAFPLILLLGPAIRRLVAKLTAA